MGEAYVLAGRDLEARDQAIGSDGRIHTFVDRKRATAFRMNAFSRRFKSTPITRRLNHGFMNSMRRHARFIHGCHPDKRHVHLLTFSSNESVAGDASYAA